MSGSRMRTLDVIPRMRGLKFSARMRGITSSVRMRVMTSLPVPRPIKSLKNVVEYQFLVVLILLICTNHNNACSFVPTFISVLLSYYPVLLQFHMTD